MDIFLIVHFLFLLWGLGKYSTNCRISTKLCVKTSAKIFVCTFHSVQVVAIAEAHMVMVTEAVQAMEAMAIIMAALEVMETMPSKGKSK